MVINPEIKILGFNVINVRLGFIGAVWEKVGILTLGSNGAVPYLMRSISVYLMSISGIANRVKKQIHLFNLLLNLLRENLLENALSLTMPIFMQALIPPLPVMVVNGSTSLLLRILSPMPSNI